MDEEFKKKNTTYATGYFDKPYIHIVPHSTFLCFFQTLLRFQWCDKEFRILGTNFLNLFLPNIFLPSKVQFILNSKWAVSYSRLKDITIKFTADEMNQTSGQWLKLHKMKVLIKTSFALNPRNKVLKKFSVFFSWREDLQL